MNQFNNQVDKFQNEVNALAAKFLADLVVLAMRNNKPVQDTVEHIVGMLNLMTKACDLSLLLKELGRSMQNG